MNKEEFLAELAQKLSDLPASEREKSVAYFDELIEDRIEEGMREEEALSSFETPEEIAKKIMIELPLSTLVKARITPQKKLTSLNIVLLCIAFPIWFPLSIAVVAVVFALYVSVWAVIVSLYACLFAFSVAGLLSLFTIGLTFGVGVAPGVFALGMSLFCLALSVLLFFPVRLLSYQLIRFTKWITIKLKSLFIRKEIA